jgi:superfamily II DNA/RNA helicase
VFVKAKTGTGKTLGFLIPAIEVRNLISDLWCSTVIERYPERTSDT